ncbi:MAG: hypothetical protein IT179_21965 [Acidobacteria bacterium]|nr:hypothetical protein [Acidobacteriota bacterium]
MAEPKRRSTWSEVKARLQTFDREGVVSLVADLYDASAANRRFLHSRLTPGSGTVEEYRRVVRFEPTRHAASGRRAEPAARDPTPSPQCLHGGGRLLRTDVDGSARIGRA